MIRNLQFYSFTLKASVLSSLIIAAATPVLFTFCTWSFMISMNRDITTIVRGIPSCLLSKARFIWGKSYKIRHLPKPVGRVAKGAFPLIRCFKQFLSSLRIAFTFGKSLSTPFAAIVLWKDLFFIMYNPSPFKPSLELVSPKQKNQQIIHYCWTGKPSKQLFHRALKEIISRGDSKGHLEKLAPSKWAAESCNGVL